MKTATITTKNLFCDDYYFSTSFEDEFIDQLDAVFETESDGSRWMTHPANEIRFIALQDADPSDIAQYEEALLEDTERGTGLLAVADGTYYPVRLCAMKTVYERARINGYALGKVSKPVLARILSDCIAVTNGNTLIRVLENKISAMHGGNTMDYVVLPQAQLFRTVHAFLGSAYDSDFIGGNFDHSITTGVWQVNDRSLTASYEDLLKSHRVSYKRITPAIRLTTSDVGISGANLMPMLTVDGSRKIPLGKILKVDHRGTASMEKFEDNCRLLFAQYKTALNGLEKLISIEITHPIECMLGVCKYLGIGKKLAFRAAELFRGQNGDAPCTAHDIFYAICEILFLLQSEGATGSKVAAMEEQISRAYSIHWNNFDLPMFYW